MKEMFVAASAPVTKLDFGQKCGFWLEREGQSSPARRGSSEAAGAARPPLCHLPSFSRFPGSLLACWAVVAPGICAPPQSNVPSNFSGKEKRLPL